MIAAATALPLLCAAFVSAGEAPLRGAVVRRVSPGGRGELAGLEVGDVLVSCDGEAVASPEDLDRALKAARPKLTVKIGVFRGGTTRDLEIIPGAPDVYCEQHFMGYEAFLSGPNASPERNGHIRAGYVAYGNSRWREAAGHFEKAVGDGLPDKDVLRHLTEARLRSLQSEKAHGSALALFALDGTDPDSIRLLYIACLMSGRYGDAAELAERVPGPRGKLVVRMVKRERDAAQLRRADAAKAAFLLDGGNLASPLDPLGQREVRYVSWDEGIREGELTEYKNTIWYQAEDERFGDFVFSLRTSIHPLTWDWEERPIVAQVRDADGAPLLNVGVDQWGRLLLGHNWYDIVGPCEGVNPAPGENVVKIVREGRRIDAFVNDLYIASTFVEPGQKLAPRIAYTNGVFYVKKVGVSAPQAPR